jgi:hypothetical protein
MGLGLHGAVHYTTARRGCLVSSEVGAFAAADAGESITAEVIASVARRVGATVSDLVAGGQAGAAAPTPVWLNSDRSQSELSAAWVALKHSETMQ